MRKKIFLMSMLVLSFACPAMAEDGNEFIENGDTCNIDNLGTSTNNDTANIEAIWNLVSVPCSAGQYFNASTASCETCSAGSWCVAGTYDVENNQTGDGSTLCSTLANGEYTLSADGSSENTQCYRNCSTSDVAHSATVSGGVYYGGNNQCVPTSCANGWNVNAPTLEEVMGTDGVSSGYGYIAGTKTQNTDVYGITNDGEFVVDYGYKGKIHGYGQCSGYGNNNNYTWSNPSVQANLSNQTGNGCWCRIDGYTSVDGDTVALSGFWVYKDGYSGCVNTCARVCSSSMASDSASSIKFRAAMFKNAGVFPDICDANNVMLDLYDDSISNNGTKVGEGSCRYGGLVGSTTTPTKPGYRFKGWKLRNSNNNNNQ